MILLKTNHDTVTSITDTDTGKILQPEDLLEDKYKIGIKPNISRWDLYHNILAYLNRDGIMNIPSIAGKPRYYEFANKSIYI